jgi:hypothetical protein
MAEQKKIVNYLNNKDILKEIHLSKNSFCKFLNPTDHYYDLIISIDDESLDNKLNHILSNPELLTEAKHNRAKRLGIDISDILETDLVFRILCWDHIPLSPKQPKKQAKKKVAREIIDIEYDIDSELLVEDLIDDIASQEVDDMVHVRLNFPPFQHFKLNSEKQFYCVGKSHWIGDLDNGSFSKEHGKITNNLAKMYMMICEKYSMKFNWRGYSYVDEMRSSALLQLTYVGLRFNEAKSENPFAYYTQAVTNSFCRILNTEKRNQNIRDDIMEMNNLNPSWTRNTNSELFSEDY